MTASEMMIGLWDVEIAFQLENLYHIANRTMILIRSEK